MSSCTPGAGFKEAVTNSSGAVMSVMQAFALAFYSISCLVLQSRGVALGRDRELVQRHDSAMLYLALRRPYD